MRYFVEIGYDGSNYHGWQIQKNALTIQQVITENLRLLTKNNSLDIIGCGRTDSGVHAKQFFFHMTLPNQIDLLDLNHRLNNILPNDIVVKGIYETKENAHARFDASERTYRYYINQKKEPFNLNYSWFVSKELDVNLMNTACKYLCEYDDFTSFSKLHTDVKTNICQLMSAFWTRNGSNLVFEIKADRFLRNMVRSIVGTMLEIGLRKIHPEDIHQIIQSKNRSNAGTSVPAQGLFLESVKYPYEF